MMTSKPLTAFALSILTCLAIVGPGLAQAAEPAVTESITAQPTKDIFVHKMSELSEREMREAQTVEWGATNDLLLISKPGMNQYFNVYSIKPDGLKLRPLTLPKDWSTSEAHKLDASWYPTGEYFVFVAQNPGSNSYTESKDSGLNCNLWLGSVTGDGPWQLTNLPTNSPPKRGVVFPYFSPDGTKLFWAGNTGDFPEDSAFGERALYLADFHFDKATKRPVLENTQKLQPGERHDFYESHGFSPDGNKVIFSGNLRKGQSLWGLDLYTYDLRNSTFKALTDTPEVWDEFGTYSPDGKKIVWSCSAGQNIGYVGPAGERRWQNYLKSELWIMNADGSEPKQLTFFNTQGAPEFSGRRCFVGDCAWSPDGHRIIICLNQETGAVQALQRRLLFLDLGIGPPAAPTTNPTATKKGPLDRGPNTDKSAGPKTGHRIFR